MLQTGKPQALCGRNTLADILNRMDTYLHVSDIRTDEVLFVNDTLREHMRLGSDAVGNPCWQVFQSGQETRCDFCPVRRVLENPDAPVAWEQRNTATGRYYKNVSRLIDWPGRGKAHLVQITDVTDYRLAEAALKKRLEQQVIMSAISQSFTGTHDMRALIYEALKMAGEFLGVNQAFLAQYHEGEGCLECLYEWYDTDGQPYIGRQSKWPISPDMEIYRELTAKGYAAINDYHELTHPNFRRVRDYTLRAFLNIPIRVSGKFWGIIGFIINRQAYAWSQSDILLGKMIAGVFSGAVSRKIVDENLRKAKEEAERASRAKGDFLASMSHEIRTPMNAIIGMTQIARDSDDPQKMEYCLRRIDSASKHLLGIINDILDLTKIEANKLELSPSEFDLEKMLITVTEVVYFRVEEKKQNLLIHIDSDVPPVYIGDDLRLRQVIANLLTNAAKFTPEGGLITLNVHHEGQADGVSTLLFEVTDNGIGVSPEQQARLFDPFRQADSGIARKYGGTGLGLNICKGIVELMGGRIWIESELGKGSRFSFTVRMKTGNAARRPTAATLARREGISILAVDDSPEIRDYFLHVMGALRLPCDVADSGATALEMIRNKRGDPYNIFFIDWMMPDQDGVELAREIKRITCDNAVIIMNSVAEWSAIEKHAVAAGIDRFISKPLFPSLLINAINESIGVATGEGPPQSETPACDFGGHTLLVVDDIEINREIIAAVLRHTRVAIDFARNGMEALSLFKQNMARYSLILMDIQMPEMDGYEATAAIRALDAARAGSVPIIAMTANVFREDVDKCRRTGMNDHIGKPVNIKELLSKLEFYLRGTAADSERTGVAS